MKCPVCKVPMVILELNDVEIDYCLECKGIWLDAGELEILLQSSQGKDELIKSFKEAVNSQEKPRKCPICDKHMEKVWVGNEDVMIDRCSNNDGIWFDMGELEEIIKLSSIEQDNRVLELMKDMFGKK